MRIIIETSESEERVVLHPEDQPVPRRSASSDLDVATDAGPPHEDLMQALSERASAPSVSRAGEQDVPYFMEMTGSEPSSSRH